MARVKEILLVDVKHTWNMECVDDSDCWGCNKTGSIAFCVNEGCACSLPPRAFPIALSVLVLVFGLFLGLFLVGCRSGFIERPKRCR